MILALETRSKKGEGTEILGNNEQHGKLLVQYGWHTICSRKKLRKVAELSDERPCAQS